MSTPYSDVEFPPAQLKLAEWKDRFFAWLIDVIIRSLPKMCMYKFFFPHSDDFRLRLP